MKFPREKFRSMWGSVDHRRDFLNGAESIWEEAHTEEMAELREKAIELPAFGTGGAVSLISVLALLGKPEIFRRDHPTCNLRHCSHVESPDTRRGERRQERSGTGMYRHADGEAFNYYLRGGDKFNERREFEKDRRKGD